MNLCLGVLVFARFQNQRFRNEFYVHILVRVFQLVK